MSKKRGYLYIEQLKDFEMNLSEKNIYYSKSIIKNGNAIYNIRTSKANLEVNIGPNWMGYDLEIDCKNNNHKYHLWSDTDNYNLQKYPEDAREIYEEILKVLDALVSRRIFIGHIKKKDILLVELNSGEYILKKSGRFMSQQIILNDLDDAGINVSDLLVVS